MADEAESKVRLVADSQATEQVEKLAAALQKASRAEDDLQRRMQERARIVRELVRMDATRPGGVLDQFYARMGLPSAPDGGTLAGRSELARRASTGAGRSMTGTLRRGVQVGPGGGMISTVGRGVSEGLIESAGLPTSIGVAGAVGLVLHQGMRTAEEAEKIRATPFLTREQQKDELRTSLPILGPIIRGARSVARLISGADRAEAQVRAEGAINLAQATGEGRIAALQGTMGAQAQAADTRAAAFQGLRLDRVGSHDRGTVLGEKLFEEESRLLESRRRLTIASKNREAAEATAKNATADYAKAEKDAALARNVLRQTAAGRYGLAQENVGFAGERVANVQATEQEREAQKRYDDALQRQREASERKLQAEQNAVAARQAEAQARAGVAQGQAEILAAREATARGNASRLGFLGVEGRMRGRLAFQLVQRIGAGNATAEQLQAAAAYAPETVRKMLEPVGEREAKVAAKVTGGSGEFRDTDLKEISKKADEAREEAAKRNEEAMREGLAEAGSHIRTAMGELTKVIAQEIDAAITKMIREGQTRNHSGG